MTNRIIIFLAFVLATLASPLSLAADASAANAKRGTPVGTGDSAPDFTLADQDGRQVTLSAEWKKQPVVLVFYRGHW